MSKIKSSEKSAVFVCLFVVSFGMNFFMWHWM